jgi:hypothetical protein
MLEHFQLAISPRLDCDHDNVVCVSSVSGTGLACMPCCASIREIECYGEVTIFRC